GLDGLERFAERQAAIKAQPSSGVAMPLDIEAITAHPVEPRERSIELFAQVFWEARPVALHEPVAVSVPCAENVDGIIELGRSDGREESRLQNPVDEALAGRGDGGLFGRRRTGGPAFHRHAATPLEPTAVRQFQGRSSASLTAG